MSRQIISAKKSADKAGSRAAPGIDSSAAPRADNYSDKLLKLIPAEVVGVYLSMQTILHGNKGIDENASIIVFLFGVFATFLYLRVTLKVSNLWQLAISAGAFCIWAWAMNAQGSITDDPSIWQNSTYAGLSLIAYTFFAPMFLAVTQK